MIPRLIYWLLGLPPAIDLSRLRPFDNTPPEVVIHERNIPASLISFMIATSIALFVTQTSILQDASTATKAWFNGLADFMSEAFLIEIFIRVAGFALDLILFWVIPLSLFLIAAFRSVLEVRPSIKNHRDPTATE